MEASARLVRPRRRRGSRAADIILICVEVLKGNVHFYVLVTSHLTEKKKKKRVGDGSSLSLPSSRSRLSTHSFALSRMLRTRSALRRFSTAQSKTAAQALNARLDSSTDPELFSILEHEKQRQRNSLVLIASENCEFFL
jgi:hypothetical protein